MIDVLIAGAGPAGAVAALVLARAGARVLIVDRARFPRDKLCGDTVNPGTLAVLHRLGLDDVARTGHRIDGMVVTGDGGVRVQGRYAGDVCGRALLRRHLDQSLLQTALAAGASFEEELTVRAPVVDHAPGGRARVAGLVISRRGGGSMTVRARVTIAADGRRSRIALACGLARHPARPRRWAIGAYFSGVAGLCSMGEMHVRRSYYLGVAPLPDGLTNVCLVTSPTAGGGPLQDPGGALWAAIRADQMVEDRFREARLISAPVSLGPLAVDVRAAGAPGLLLAGDAAGFIDPLTGDGLRFAVRGGELAARAVLDALAAGPDQAHERLASWRAKEFGAKWRFNRVLRRLVDSPCQMRLAATMAACAPGLLQRVIDVAGDVGLARAPQI